MSIQSEIERLQNAKENLKTAIAGKGVAVPDSAKLDEYSSFVNGIQQGNNVDLSFVTAGAGDILSGKTGTDKDGNPVNGSIETVTPTLSDNKFTVKKGYVPENKELTVPVVTATLSKNVATVPVGYIAKPQTLTVPEAEAPTVDGNVVTIHAGYVPTEQTIETEGGGGGSMEIYKCAEVVEAAAGDGYVITGAGDAILNGTYTISKQSDSEVEYHNENGAILLHLVGSQWMLFDDQWSQKWDSNSVDYASAADVPSWNCYVGEYPAPTVTALEGKPASWSGYLYNTETKEFSDTLTEGLAYKMAAPIVGKCYNADATMLIDLYAPEGLVFYTSLHKQQTMDETGRSLSCRGAITHTTVLGVPCCYFDGSSWITASDKGFAFGVEARSLSFFVYRTSDIAAFIISYGLNSANNRFGMGYELNGDFAIWGSGNTAIHNQKIEKNKWYHIVVTFVGDVESLYVDGIYIDTVTHSNINTLSGEMCIGSGAISHDEPLTGYISEVKVWNRVLSANEIKAEADRCLAMVEESESTSNGYVISNAGTVVVNGTYTLFSDDESRTTYKNENEVEMYYSKEHDYWNIGMDGTDYYFAGSVGGETDPTKVTWVVDFGSEPVPTVTKA